MPLVFGNCHGTQIFDVQIAFLLEKDARSLIEALEFILMVAKDRRQQTLELFAYPLLHRFPCVYALYSTSTTQLSSTSLSGRNCWPRVAS